MTADALFLYRHRPSSQRLFFNPGAATEAIDASQFDFGTTYGIETSTIWYDPKTFTDFELRGMWVNDWESRVDQVFTGPSVQIATNPVIGTTGPRNGAAFYGSQLGSVELNARYRMQKSARGITFVGGFRHVRLTENLNATLADPGGIIPDELLQVNAVNRLFGLQLGADAVFCNGELWCLKGVGRVAVLGNDTRQNTQLVSLSSPPVSFGATGKAGEISLLAELGVSGRVRLSSCVNLMAGYRAIYIDGLTLASEQLASANFLTQSGMNHNGAVLLHAANVGLEFVY